MQFCLLLLPLPARKHFSLSWIVFGRRNGDRLAGGIGPAAAARANGGTDQDHYSVLGIRRSATPGEIKQAYRRLAREHHPDVNKNQQAGEFFKKIRLAYEVLSDEVRRAEYNISREIPFIVNKSQHPKWEELRRMHNRRNVKSNRASWSFQTEAYEDHIPYKRSSFIEVLQFAFFTLLVMQTIGCRAALTLAGITALLDQRLDAGYKAGYAIAWILGGRAGILLALCVCFASWVCGKNSSNIVALMVVAMWIGGNIAAVLPLPQGAVLTLIYMSMKLQVGSK